MKLRTSLQLSAIFPILFAIIVIVVLGYAKVELSIESIAIFGLLGIIMAAVIISYSRSILAKIRMLNLWADEILKGDFSGSVEVIASNDEVGHLSRALRKMLDDLQGAYAALHKETEHYKGEMEKRRQSQKVAETAAKALSEALGRLKTAEEFFGLLEEKGV